MIVSESKIRVRYGETDKMGYVYYGNYPLYYEVGRTDMVRKLGWSYSKMEENGTMMPVLSLNVKYIRPAYYDDLLTVRTYLKTLPSSRIDFEYEVSNEAGDLLNVGSTTLVFVNAETMRPQPVPEALLSDIKAEFEKYAIKNQKTENQ